MNVFSFKAKGIARSQIDDSTCFKYVAKLSAMVKLSENFGTILGYTIQLKSLNIALNNYFTDYPDSKLYGGIRDGPTDFKSEDIFCYALGPK